MPPQRIILAGRSLGSAVAVELATRVSPGGLLLFSAIDSVPATASRLYFWAPVGLLASQRFDSLAKAPRVMVPVLQVHSSRTGWCRSTPPVRCSSDFPDGRRWEPGIPGRITTSASVATPSIVRSPGSGPIGRPDGAGHAGDLTRVGSRGLPRGDTAGDSVDLRAGPRAAGRLAAIDDRYPPDSRR